jgi:hypothetical protein
VNERNDVDVDLDRLADFLSGALDGTPEADAVRRLLATDARWSRAYAALVDADAAVRADLSAYATHSPPLPPDVADRLDAALRAASQDAHAPVTARHADGPHTGARHADLPQADRSHTAPQSDRPPGRARDAEHRPGLRRPGGTGGSGTSSGTASGTASSARRRWRIALSAAAVVAAVALGAGVLLPQLTRHTAGTGTAGNEKAAPAAADSAQQGQLSGSVPVLASGTDYRRDTLGTLISRTPFAAPGAGRSAASVPEGPHAADAAGAVPDELTQLTGAAARAACLDAITRQYGGTVAVVDYARYEGLPALVVVLTGTRVAADRRWVVVVGPTCGHNGAIGDERFSGPLG